MDANFSAPMELFGLPMFTAGPSWRIWRPGDEPFTSTDVVAGCRGGTVAGGLSGMNLSYPGEPRLTAPMCLFRKPNLISDTIHAEGRWHDCASLTDAWRQLRPAPKSLMLEVGGNIGACSMELLLRTDVRLIIFEPSPTNLYYLTRTFHAAHHHCPHLRLADRVVVFPIGLGNESSRTKLFADTRNSGDSIVVGPGEKSAASTASSRHHFASQGRVVIHPFDALMPPGWRASRAMPSTTIMAPLMKIDVQGFECRVLQGMRRLLAAHAVGAVFTEVSLSHLARAGCSKAGLLGALKDFGYRVDQPDGPRGHWSWDVLAVVSSSLSNNTRYRTRTYRR